MILTSEGRSPRVGSMPLAGGTQGIYLNIFYVFLILQASNLCCFLNCLCSTASHQTSTCNFHEIFKICNLRGNPSSPHTAHACLTVLFLWCVLMGLRTGGAAGAAHDGPISFSPTHIWVPMDMAGAWWCPPTTPVHGSSSSLTH